ncbi:MAG: D-tyrosyl-tRNA(Tyr) deacylase [Chromatiales bacterium]|nr:D-tyrosyl-tRNA(Tyr) deacylase [Chromatiales bacterium]
MISLLQRVSCGSVCIEGDTIAEIARGILVLVAVQPNDGEQSAARMAERILGYRIFSNNEGRMNLSVMDVKGEVLLVPQFTLAADTTQGMRPSFTRAAQPDIASSLFKYLYAEIQRRYQKLSCGKFGAYMQVKSVNEGPVTFILTV